MKKGNELKLKSVTKVTKKSVFFFQKDQKIASILPFYDSMVMQKRRGGGKIDNRPEMSCADCAPRKVMKNLDMFLKHKPRFSFYRILCRPQWRSDQERLQNQNPTKGCAKLICNALKNESVLI